MIIISKTYITYRSAAEKIYVCVHIYTYMCIHLYVYMSMYIYICTYKYIYVQVCTNTHLHIYHYIQQAGVIHTLVYSCKHACIRMKEKLVCCWVTGLHYHYMRVYSLQHSRKTIVCSMCAVEACVCRWSIGVSSRRPESLGSKWSGWSIVDYAVHWAKLCGKTTLMCDESRNCA